MLFDAVTLTERIRAAERALLQHLYPDKADPAVLCTVEHLLRTEGRARIGDAASALALSPRQLERRFGAAMGLSPKALAGLIRYQLLWQEIAFNPRFDPQDAVERFGYSDQAHLLHDFRSRHLMSPRKALAFARR